MKNRIFFTFLFVLAAATLYAQQGVAVNTDASAADPTAILDVKSYTKGILIPRLSTQGRTGIATPANGLLVYDTTAKAFYFSQKGTWRVLSINQNYWDLNGATNTEIKNSNTGGFWSAKATALVADTTGVKTPVNGKGTRLMWLPNKSAFRVGTVTGTNWDSDSIGTWSFAQGLNSKAVGVLSVAMGQSYATAYNATALGQSYAYGQYSTALGSSHATNNYSTAMGAGYASGQYSVAGGEGTVASNDNAVAFGQGSVASGTTSAAFNYATASGDVSFAMGAATSNGYASTGMGFNTRTEGSYAVTMGLGTIARSYSSLAIGLFNDTVSASTTNDWVPSEPLIYVGNGTGPNARSNVMLLTKAGDLGMGTNVPKARLDIKANSNIGYPQLLLEEPENDYARLSFKNSTTTNFWTIAASPAPVASNSYMNFYLQGVGNIFTVRGNGNATLSGVLTQSSDARMKKNIRPVFGVLARINNLNAYTYQWKDETKDQDQQIGFIAQQVEKVFPDMVKTDENGNKSVAYTSMIPILLQAIKEQQKQIEELTKEVNEIKKRK